MDTEPGRGTTFTLTVPVSRAITCVLLVESCDLLVAIPVGAVEEMLLLKDLTVHPAAAQETIDWEGDAVPLIRLRVRLQFHRPRPVAQSENRASMDEAFVPIVARHNAPFALHFDRYWGEQEVTVRDLQSPYPLPPVLAAVPC